MKREYSTIQSGYNVEARLGNSFHFYSPTEDEIMFNNDLINILGKSVRLIALGGSLELIGKFDTYTYPPMQRFSVTASVSDQFVFNYNEIKAIHYPTDSRFYSGQDFIIELWG